MEIPESMNKEQTDTLVKKVIELSEEERAKRRKKNVLIYLLCVMISIAEFFIIYDIHAIIRNIELMPVFMIVLFSIGFGAYFWIFIKEKLPSYYDENKIGVYVDGILHMNMPGVVFNNNNWPYIVKALRGWSVFGMIIIPVIYWLYKSFVYPLGIFVDLTIILGFILGGLFIPVFILGRKYQYGDNPPAKNESKSKKRTFWWIVIVVIFILAVCFGDITSINSATRIMFFQSEGINYWKAEYQYLDGFMTRTLLMEEDDVLNVSVETDEGDLTLQIMDANGNVIYSEVRVGTKEFDVEVSGQIYIRVEAEEHEGSFSFK